MGGTSTTLKPEVINDLQNCTAFTHAEICDIYRQFRADCEHDHHEMTREDFTNMYLKVRESRVSVVPCKYNAKRILQTGSLEQNLGVC